HASGATISVSATASDLPVAPYSEISGNLTTLGNVQLYSGTSDPTSSTGIGTAGPGSLHIRTDNPYRNVFLQTGTTARPRWQYVAGSQGPLHKWGTIASADITGTSAGQLGHANGYPLVAAPSTNDYPYLFPIVCFLHYTRTTATYGGGGNVTVNYA